MAYQSIVLTKVSFIAIAGVSACTAAVGSVQAEPPPDFKNIDAAPFTSESAPQSILAREMMVTVPAGSYTLGRSDGPTVEQPEQVVELQAFQIDRTEVTNAAFAEYLNALAIPVSRSFEAGSASRDDLTGASVALLMEEGRSSGLYPIIALDDAQARIGYRDGAFRVTRGGDYIYDANAATLTATHRDGFSNAPGRGHRHIGFRCAADVSAQQG